MDRILKAVMDKMLSGVIREGSLRVLWPDGSSGSYGPGGAPAATMRLADGATMRAILLNPGLAFGEAYMSGQVEPVGCGIQDVLHVLMLNMRDRHSNVAVALRLAARQAMKKVLQSNRAARAKTNVAHHYDLNGRLYALFLDQDRQYSCAYFARGDETLDEAQAAKKRHIAAKLKLDRPGLEVLDIGCGWGGMAITLARDYGAVVTGITLSEEQLVEARRRAAVEGLADRVTFQLMDYRAMNQRFDRIVSVGMFEHVGQPNYTAFFRTVKRCLKPDGVALLHSIGRFAGAGATNPWLAKYIFPGGYSPALSEVLEPIEKSGLLTTDIEILRLHYAKTIAHWRRNFGAKRDAIASLYDERFCRMFEFYLAGSELAFRVQDHMNFQIQLVRQPSALPLARDYMVDAERETQLELSGD